MAKKSAKVYPTEYEIKLDLGSRDNYSKLVEELGTPLDIYNQENHFLDTRERTLLKSHWAFRVRIVAASEVPGIHRHSYAEVTLKGPETGEGIMAERHELNDPISLIAALSLVKSGIGILSPSVSPIVELRKMVGSKRLFPLVSFKNKRTLFDKSADCGCYLELDLTTFGRGILGYELEMEFDEPNAEAIERAVTYVRRLFQKLNIPYEIQRTSKFATALKNHSLLD